MTNDNTSGVNGLRCYQKKELFVVNFSSIDLISLQFISLLNNKKKYLFIRASSGNLCHSNSNIFLWSAAPILILRDSM